MRGGQGADARGKAQIAVEFIVAYSLVLIIFLVFFGLVASQRAASLNQQEYSTVQLVAENVASYLDQAVTAGNGYNATIPLVTSVGFSNYNLSISSTGVVVASVNEGGQKLSAESFSSARNLQVNGSVIASSNSVKLYLVSIPGGLIRLANRNGIVYVNELPTTGNVTNLVIVKQAAYQKAATTTFSANSFITVQNNNLGLINNLLKYTVAVWVRPNNTNIGTILDEVQPSTGCPNGGFGGSPLSFTMWNNGYAGNWQTWTTSVSLAPNAWQFITLTENSLNVAGAGTGTLYINGVQVAQGTLQDTNAPASDLLSDILGGGSPCPGPAIGSFNGLIANFQVYNGILNATQISTLYAAGISGAPVMPPTAGVIVWLPLNGNANDYSGNGRSGSVQNVAYQGTAQISAIGYQSNGTAGNTLIGMTAAYPATYAAGTGGFAGFSNKTIGPATTIFTSNAGAGSINVTINGFNENFSTAFHTILPYNGLVGWWPLDEGSGNYVYDTSGSGMVGTFSSGKWVTSPQNASSMFAMTVNGLGSGNVQSGVPQTGKKSVSLWLSTTATTQQGVLDAGTCSASYEGFGIYLTSSGGVGGSPPINTQGLYFDGESDDIYIPYNLAGGTWKNVIVSWNGGQQVYMSINGTLPSGYVWNGVVWSPLTTQPFTLLSSLNPPNSNVIMGAARCLLWSTGSQYFNGKMLNVQLYNSTLTPLQMQQLHSAGPAGFPLAGSGLIGWWPLSGGTFDSSKFGNNAVAYNSVFYSIAYIAPTPQSTAPKYAYFNGTAGSILYSTFPTPGLPENLCNFTINTWTYPEGISSGNGGDGLADALVCGVCSTFWPSGYEYMDPTQVEFSFVNTSKTYSVYSDGSFGYHWNLLTTVLRNGTETGYVNGVNVTGVPKWVGCYAEPKGYIGGLGGTGSGDAAFNGSVADVMTYNTALTPVQVQQIYADGLNPAVSVQVGAG